MIEAVTISYTLAEWLTDHAQHTPTVEVCGMLGGKILHQQIHIRMGQRLTNIAAQPSHSYEFAPQEFIQTYYAWQQRQIDWVGVYHSHPTGSLEPSPTDIARAHYQQIAYLIVGKITHNWEIKAWYIINQQVISLPIHFTP